MAAANTDLLKKLSRRWVGQIGSGGVADAVATTIPLSSTTNLATDTAVVATIDRVDANGTATASLEETVVGVVSGSNLITTTRGVEGTAQAHAAGAVVEILVTAKGYNDIIDHLLTEHTQLGAHQIKAQSLVAGSYVTDTGAADAYVATLSPAATAYTTGMLVAFKAANTNTGASTINVNALGVKSIKKGDGATALAAADITAGQIVQLRYDGTNFQMVSPTPSAGVTASSTTTFTNKTIIDSTNKISFNAPQGFLINGKIVPSVASSNITVAIKGVDGNDPSASNPVYIRIGDTVRSITAALSVTKNAGTNWFNSGSTELAAQEIDYFVYLGYNATDGVVIGFARIPFATKYGDFSITTTNDRYCAISTITTAASTDYYENVGRFAASLSASASFNWSVPTFTALNLLQRPTLFTRWLAMTPVFTGFSANPSGVGTMRYCVAGSTCTVSWAGAGDGTSNATTFTINAPLASGASCSVCLPTGVVNNGSWQTGRASLAGSTNAITFGALINAAGNFTSSGIKSGFLTTMVYEL